MRVILVSAPAAGCSWQCSSPKCVGRTAACWSRRAGTRTRTRVVRPAQHSQAYPPHHANRSRSVARPRGSSAPRAERDMVRHRFPGPAMSSSTARKPGEGRWMRNHRAKHLLYLQYVGTVPYCSRRGSKDNSAAEQVQHGPFVLYGNVHMVPYSNIAGRYWTVPSRKGGGSKGRKCTYCTVPRTEDSVLRDIVLYLIQRC
jgi:hypothetical protein